MKTTDGVRCLLLSVVFFPSTTQATGAPGTWAGRLPLGAMARSEENTVNAIRGTRGAPRPYPAFASG